MTQARLFDGTVLNFPDGTSPDVINRVAKEQTLKLRGGSNAPAAPAAPPAPALSTAGDPMYDNPPAFTPGQPVGTLDLLKSFGSDVIGVIDQGMRGAAEGVMNVGTLPNSVGTLTNKANQFALDTVGVDDPRTQEILSAIMNPMTAAMAQTPSAQDVKGVVNAANDVTADTIGVTRPDQTPDNMAERVIHRIGEEVGGFAAPEVGMLRAAEKLGPVAARTGNWFERKMLAPLAVDPTAALTKDIAMAGGAGLGAGAAKEMFSPEEGSSSEFWTDLIGALTGGGITALGTKAGGSIGQVVKAATGKESYVDDVVKEAVVDKLAQAAGISAPPGGVRDTDALVDIIQNGDRVSDVIPGVVESLADRTKNPGIASLEYAEQSGKNAGLFAQRRAANAGAIDRTMSSLAPDGNAAELRGELDTERTRRLGEAATTRQGADDALSAASRRLQSTMTAEGRGADIRAALEGASEEARAVVREAWAPLNQTDVTMDASPLAERFSDISDNMSVAERQRFRPAEADIPGHLGEGPQPVREVTGLRSALADAAREAQRNGQDARIINEHIAALDQVLDANVPESFRSQYEAARGARRDVAERFERPTTAIAQTLDTRQGRYRQPDSGVARKFVQEDEGRISDFEDLMRETGADARVQGAVRDQILNDVNSRGLLDNPEGLQEYLGRYGTVLNRFPALRDELGNAGRLRTAAGEARTAETNMQRELGTDTAPGKGIVGKYLQYSDANTDKAVREVLASKDPAKAVDELLTFAGNKPAAVKGAQQAFWDTMEKQGRRAGETTKTIDGAQPWMPAALKRFVDDPRNAAVADRLYKDNPEHLKNIHTVIDALQGLDVRNSGKAPNTSGTAQSILPSAETIASRTFAVQRGQVGVPFLFTTMAAMVGRRLVRNAQSSAIERMTAEMLLDPDAAAILVKQNNPANRAAMRVHAKAWFGNDAAKIMNQLSGDDEDDETTRAVTGK